MGINKIIIMTIPTKYSHLKSILKFLCIIKCGANEKTGTIKAIGPLVIIPNATAENAMINELHFLLFNQLANCQIDNITHAINIVSVLTSCVIKNIACVLANIKAANPAISLL